MAASAASSAADYSAAAVKGANTGLSSEMVVGLSTAALTDESMAYQTVMGMRPEKCILPRIDWNQVDITRPTTIFPLHSALHMTGVAAFSNLISIPELNILAEEARALIHRPDVGNINFEGGAPTAWRRQCKLMAEEARVTAPRTYEWCESLLKKLQHHAALLCTPAHKVEYIAIIENLQGRRTTAQLLHADRGLAGSPNDPESFSLVLHLPLTDEGQRLSMLLGSHNHHLPFGMGTEAYICHDMTKQTEGIIHFAHLIHAASAEPEGLTRLRLVINLSAKKPPPGPENVLLHLVDGQYATAQPVTVAAAQAWLYGTAHGVSKEPKRRLQRGAMRDGAKVRPKKRRPQSRPHRGNVVSGAACSTRSMFTAETDTSEDSDEDLGDARGGKTPITSLGWGRALILSEALLHTNIDLSIFRLCMPTSAIWHTL